MRAHQRIRLRRLSETSEGPTDPRVQIEANLDTLSVSSHKLSNKKTEMAITVIRSKMESKNPTPGGARRRTGTSYPVRAAVGHGTLTRDTEYCGYLVHTLQDCPTKSKQFTNCHQLNHNVSICRGGRCIKA
ncbi:hypothetical protein NDU88_001605 [Pleurodeles waltl]|uniref:Uncharacterized protein n=1 Tax=Pleurodeles waltl TaxID=8319 RepID=A0AAV7Q7C5_PLEWA|nr:hypothetical protein NDU88_001605 [Pleurodeles waltl]